MIYRLLDILLGNLLMKEAEKVPKCKACKKRMEKQGPPRLFLLPVYSDGVYAASGEYFRKNCTPIQSEAEIPTSRRACRVWRLRCPVCGTQKILVHDFLRVQKDEVFEGSYLYEYQDLADLLYRQPDGRPAEAPRHIADAAYSTHIPND